MLELNTCYYQALQSFSSDLSDNGGANVDVKTTADSPSEDSGGVAISHPARFKTPGLRLQPTERLRVQSIHQRGTCRVWTGRDGEGGVSHEHILIFCFMSRDVLQKRREQSRAILNARNGEISRKH